MAKRIDRETYNAAKTMLKLGHSISKVSLDLHVNRDSVSWMNRTDSYEAYRELAKQKNKKYNLKDKKKEEEPPAEAAAEEKQEEETRMPETDQEKLVMRKIRTLLALEVEAEKIMYLIHELVSIMQDKFDIVCKEDGNVKPYSFKK